MNKEFEIGLNLIKSVQEHLKALQSAEDRAFIRGLVKAIINPITASAYQIKVGEGPKKEELLKVLLPMVRLMRDMDNLDELKPHVKELLRLVEDIDKELGSVAKDGTTG